MPLFETSAKDDEKCDHVEAIFLTLAHKINANKLLLFRSKEETTTASVVRVEQANAVQEDDSGSCCF